MLLNIPLPQRFGQQDSFDNITRMYLQYVHLDYIQLSPTQKLAIQGMKIMTAT